MSGLTAEAARAAAEWLESRSPSMAFDLRAEADWLEDAAKTPGQVAFRAYHALWTDMPSWEVNGPIMRAQWDAAAASVIDHHACLTPWPAGLTVDDVELCARYAVGLSAASDDEIMAAGNRVLSALR